MIDRAVKFLEQPNHIFDEPHRALAAMALVKAGRPATHPLVQAAVKECQDVCRSKDTVGRVLDIYGTAVVGLFFAELDPSAYEKEIKNVIESLAERQKKFGGWGYAPPSEHAKHGDTSMTQYAVLCAWLAKATGAAEMEAGAVRRVTNWLIRTQDPTGAWGYQGVDPGGSGKRVKQSEVRHSLCAAGLGSVYICSNMLGFTSADGLVVTDTELPPALKPILEMAKDSDTADTTINKALLKRAMRDGDSWHAKNYRIYPPEYTMYYLYTLERYQSFKELAAGKIVKEPRWYNDGVRLLQKSQRRDGSWQLEDGTTDIADTTFGVFFLVRSTKKSIAKASDELDGLLVAGRGLPSNTGNVRMKRGKVVTTPFQGTANALLEILGDQDHPDFESASNSDAMQVSRDPAQRREQLRRLRRLMKAESYQVRLVAAKTLGTAHDLENVPALIYGLSDPDQRVALAARNSLRFTARKFNGMGLEFPASPQRLQEVTDAWKQWYKKLRPDAQFIQ